MKSPGAFSKVVVKKVSSKLMTTAKIRFISCVFYSAKYGYTSGLIPQNANLTSHCQENRTSLGLQSGD